MTLWQWAAARCATTGLRLTPRPGRVWPVATVPRQPRADDVRRAERETLEAWGVRIALTYLAQRGDTDIARLGGSGLPWDVMSRQHAVEVKTGAATNTGSSAQWRSTTSGPKAGERRTLAALSTGEAVAAYWADKRAYRLARRFTILRAVQRHLAVTPVTLGLIVDLEAQAVDVFWLPDWFNRLGWTSRVAQQAYGGTFAIEEA
jgi:hypothetical protein